VQEWDLSDPCHDHLQNQQNMLQCSLVEDLRTDPISTWHYAFGHPSTERTRHICRCYNVPGVRNLEMRVSNFLKTAQCVEKQKVFKIVIIELLLDLQYEVNGGLQTLKDYAVSTS